MRIRPNVPLTDEELLRFCAENDLLRIEREPNGELTVMSPTGTGMGEADSELNFQLRAWARETNSGAVFSSSTGFRLRDGSMRSPDASWMSWSRWNAVPPEQKKHGFAPVCPEFVIELRSPTDRLSDLEAKMGEWIRNGAELAWLIDPERQVVEVSRPGLDRVDVLEGVTSVAGEGSVAGFVLDLAKIWQ